MCPAPLLALSSSLSCLLPQDGSPHPPALGLIGPLNIRASLEGSHVAPQTSVQWLVPGTAFSGRAAFGPASMNIAAAGGGWELAAAADVTTPHAHLAREANTQVRLGAGTGEGGGGGGHGWTSWAEKQGQGFHGDCGEERCKDCSAGLLVQACACPVLCVPVGLK
jgi:hypothetical protein